MGVRGGALESPSSSLSPTKTRPREGPRAREIQIRRRGIAPEMGRSTRPRRVSRVASSPRGEPSCQIVQRALEDARVSLERRRKNHDRAIDDIGEAGKNVRTPGEPIYNPGCLALTRQQRYVVWPDKFKPDITTRYDGTTNPVEFLQLYVIAVQAVRGDQRAMANWFPMALKDAP
jgi:hypothetical protein